MKIFIGLCAAAVTVSTLVGCSASGGTPEEQRASIDSMANDVLQELYEQEPQTKKMVEDSVGYAVFSNVGTAIIFVTTGGGFGVAVNDATNMRTYMKMGEVGVGLGLGVKDFRAVFIFHNESTMNQFINSGWEFGAEADAAAKAGDKGGEGSGAATASSGMTIYQITDAGAMLAASISGTKYWKDSSLNN